MDDFYAALANGLVKASGVMNYIQHLMIAERCPPGASVVDMCCGRALMLPLLKRYASNIRRYIGVDISHANLLEARRTDVNADGGTFTRVFLQGDVTRLSSLLRDRADVIVYTSALEHMERSAGKQRLVEASHVLRHGGVLFLSTPRTEGPRHKRVQYKVHVYEWGQEEVEEVITATGLSIEQRVGLLVQEYAILVDVVERVYGAGARQWFERMRQTMPLAFFETIAGSCFPGVAREVLYVCRRR